MSIHAIESGGLLYIEASGLYSADGSEVLRYYPYAEEATPEKFINLLKQRQGIDLKKRGKHRK